MSLYDCTEPGVTVGDMTMEGNVVEEFPLNCPAWHVENLYEWWVLTELRGSDRVRPGVDGEFAIQHRRAKVRRPIELFIEGAVDRDGDPYPTLMEGLYSNLKDIESNLLGNHPSNAKGLRTLTLIAPTGDALTGLVRVKNLDFTDVHRRARHAYAVLDVELPGGALT